jgi:triacylglycerol esterase/lipase EstA (alpha/beta hydrolase family)
MADASVDAPGGLAHDDIAVPAPGPESGSRETTMIKRRDLWNLLLSALLLTACAALPQPTPPPAQALPPVVFVHGNGDSAALWLTTLWRFESNGWPRERLHAVEFP